MPEDEPDSQPFDLPSPSAVITITGGGGIVDLNQGAQRMFGVRQAEALRTPIADLLAAAETRAPAMPELGIAVSQDPSRLLDRELEVTLSGPDGRPYAATLMVARAGPLFIVWIRDVSDQAESEKRLAVLERAAEIAGVDRLQIAREIAGHIAIEEVLATWVPFDHEAERLLARLGEAMDFNLGVLWVRRGNVLEARGRWNFRSTEVSDSEVIERPLKPGPGQALAVEAWHSRQPIVVVSLPDAPPFLGQDAAVGAGFRGAVALPAVHGDLAFAVFEFYSRESLQPTDTLLRSLTGMGHGLGHFFARRSGELRPQELTAREREILQLTAQGMSGKAIAQQLSLSPSTVKTHFENIYAKWDVSDRASAVAKAIRAGLIQ